MSTVAKLLKSGTPLVDVRTEEEFLNGHVDGAVNIPLSRIPGSLKQLRELGEPLVVCGKSVNRTVKAVELLKQKGIQNVHNVGDWREAKHIKYSL